LIVIVSGFTQAKPPVKKVYGYKQASIPVFYLIIQKKLTYNHQAKPNIN
jgi:hypothetical protein